MNECLKAMLIPEHDELRHIFRQTHRQTFMKKTFSRTTKKQTNYITLKGFTKVFFNIISII